MGDLLKGKKRKRRSRRKWWANKFRNLRGSQREREKEKERTGRKG